MRISDWSSDVCSSDLLDFSHPETIRSGLSLITIAKFSQFYQAAVGAGQLHNPGSIGRLIASSPRKSGHAVVPIPCGAKRERATASGHPLQRGKIGRAHV